MLDNRFPRDLFRGCWPDAAAFDCDNDLHLDELATMFSCSKSKIDRDVKRAGKRVREATLNYVREVDPWLELKWRDFMTLCRVASPACFGTE